ncbi:MAG: hypothetical protein Q8J63_08575 [Candidatus Aquicultor sp.]|nr:hypothetical protein [Candidatus Aquicultor sp.]
MNKTLILFLIVMMAVFAVTPAAALAAPIPDELHISLWPEYDDNQVLFLEGVRFSDNTPLPIEVKMAVPKGMTVIWVGELLGGEAAQDVEATHKTNPKDDYDEVVFTLTKSRIGQLEAQWAGLKVDGKARELNLEWVQRYGAKQVTFDFRVPTQTSDVKMSPPASTPGGSTKGEEFISVAPMKLAVGQKQNFTITYQRSTNAPSVSEQPAQQQPGTPAGKSTTSSAAIAIIVFAVIAVAMLTVYKMHNVQPVTQDEPKQQRPPARKKPARDREEVGPNELSDDDEQGPFFD